ncbi:MAG: hypothetical protein ACI4TM_11565 [Candidatus Cryptobacteroides sp.]
MARSEIFNWERFGKYFIHDLGNNFRDNWIAVLFTSLVPLYVIALFFIFNTTVGGTDWRVGGEFTDLVCAVTMTLFLLFYPISAYSHATSKGSGKIFLMLPASGTEKFISTVIISIIVAPATFCTIYFGLEFVLNTLFASRYPDPAYNLFFSNVMTQPLSVNVQTLRVTGFSTFFLPAMVSSAGLCGCFLFNEKNKKAKTFFTCAVSFILLSILAIFLVDNAEIESEKILNNLVLLWIVFESICTAAMLIYTYFRMKSIQL